MRAVSCSLSVRRPLHLFATLMYNCSETPCAWWETEQSSWLGRWISVSLARASLPRLVVAGVAVEDTVVCAGGQTVLARLSCCLPSPCTQYRSRRGSRARLGWGVSSVNKLAKREPLSAG